MSKKAISLWQPFASLIMLGSKKIETRHWPTNYRGPLLIHAAKHKVKQELEYYTCAGFNAAFHAIGGVYAKQLFDLPYGALLGTVDLVDCKSVSSFDYDKLKERQYSPSATDAHKQSKEQNGYWWHEEMLGNYENGRFGWVLENPKPFDVPIQYKGSQGFFEVSDHVALRAQCYRSTEGDAIAL